MIRIAFTAKRAIHSHAVGDTVTLTLSAAEMTPSRRVVRDTQKSLSGRRETLYHNGTRTWSVTTEPMSSTTLDQFEEFLTAVEDGSQFDFEPWYAGGSPGATDSAENRLRTVPTVRCVLGGEGYDLSRLIGDGTGGALDWYQVTFSVEEAP